jgi:hypothetical protein
MSKHGIFSSDNNLMGIAISDSIKNKFLERDSLLTSVSLTDEQFDKIRRRLANATYNGVNLNYFLITPEPIFNLSETLDDYLEDRIKRVKFFNDYNSNDITLAYEQKLKYFLIMYKSKGLGYFTDILNSKTFENWYFNQENLPDFSDLEIY